MSHIPQPTTTPEPLNCSAKIKSWKLVRRYTAQVDYDGFPSEASAIEFAKHTELAKKEGMEMHWPKPDAYMEPYRNEEGEIVDFAEVSEDF
jgi:hypothetical protein